MLAVMAVDVDRTRQISHRLGQFPRALFGNAVVTMRQVDVTHAVALRRFHVGLRAVDADHCLDAEFFQLDESLLAIGLYAGNDSFMQTVGIRKVRPLDTCRRFYGGDLRRRRSRL